MAKDSSRVGIADTPRGKHNGSSVLSSQHTSAVELDCPLPAGTSLDPDVLAQTFSTACPDCNHRVANALEGIYAMLVRLADHLAPEPADIVGTDYIAERLGVTGTWVAEMVRQGDLPKHCIVPGTGNGKVWKFYRRHVDAWLNNR